MRPPTRQPQVEIQAQVDSKTTNMLLVREAPEACSRKYQVRGKKVRKGKNTGPPHTGLEFFATSQSV